MSEKNLKRQQREAVRLGALLLDQKVPGWHNTVLGKMTAGLFQMTRWEACIAGSLELIRYGRYGPDIGNDGGFYICFNGTQLAVDEYAHVFGFVTLDECDDAFGWVAWEMLEDMWREEIQLRVHLQKALIQS